RSFIRASDRPERVGQRVGTSLTGSTHRNTPAATTPRFADRLLSAAPPHGIMGHRIEAFMQPTQSKTPSGVESGGTAQISSGDANTLPPSVPNATPASAFLSPPQGPDELGRLGHYRILKQLGAGGMGMVFQAEDSVLQRKVALKVMLPALAADPANRERFLREARAAAAPPHDHVVTIHQVGEERGI